MCKCYARHKCVKRPPPREGCNNYLCTLNAEMYELATATFPGFPNLHSLSIKTGGMGVPGNKAKQTA